MQRHPQPNEVIDVKKYFFYFLRNWYWFVLVLVITMPASWLYLRKAVRIWNTSTTILIHGNKWGHSFGEDNLMKGFDTNSSVENIENQIAILKSIRLNERAISELPFFTEYSYKGKIHKKSLYKKSPVQVLSDKQNPMPTGIEFAVYFFKGNRFRIIAEQNEKFDLNQETTWGEVIKVGNTSFSLDKTDFWKREFLDQVLYFTFNSFDGLVNSFRNRLKVDRPISSSSSLDNLQATILKMSLKGIDPDMDRDFLSKLGEVYLIFSLDNKNLEADRTISFIEHQLSTITDSLSLIEESLQNFRTLNQVMDISVKGDRLQEQVIKAEDIQIKLIKERNYYNYLTEYLQKDNVTDQVAPAIMGIMDPMLVQLVAQLAELQAEYYKMGVVENVNPMKQTLVKQMHNIKAALVETLESIIMASEMALKENSAYLKKLKSQLSILPGTERELLGIERRFKLTDELYTLLLEKQAEAKIQKASNISDYEILERATTSTSPVWPNKSKVYMLGLLAGLGLPGLILLLIKILDMKVRTEKDIKTITSLPIAIHIPHSMNKNLVVFDYPKVEITEAYRSLRTRLQFITKDTQSPVILVTSSIGGEGKTHTALNLASIYSLTRRKTILIEGDLRKPNAARNFLDYEQRTKKGLSTGLIGKHSFDEIIQSTGHEHLSVIPAGPIPPNPSELLGQEKLHELVVALKKRYDYIIIDSAPLGLVSDTFFLAQEADATLMVVRPGVSDKKILESTLVEMESSGLNHISILINGIKDGRGFDGFSFRYGNYAKYGYDLK